ncbi:hypothetical protein Scep_027952 [Stephania cephalantha]|uniref:Uncharacterized protein n=1 Tax=Stephania cephalantha TaxID=152367 RepID=A0AAP0E8W6_9MAGN
MRGRGPSRGKGQSGRGRAASGNRGSLRESDGTHRFWCTVYRPRSRHYFTIVVDEADFDDTYSHYFTDGPASSDHTSSSHSNHYGSSSRHGTPSPTISAQPSNASPAPSGGSRVAMGAPARAPRSAMELPRNLLSSPLPPASSAAPKEGRGGTPHIGYCWKSVPDHQKEIYWERWKPYFQWDPSIDEAIVRAAYDAKACVRRPQISRLALRRLHITEKVKRAALVQALQSTPALDKDEDDEITPNDVFIHVHMKDHDGVTFIDNISAQFHAKLVRRREEHTQATPDQPIDEEQLYYDAAGVCPKGRVYGLGSLTKKKR